MVTDSGGWAEKEARGAESRSRISCEATARGGMRPAARGQGWRGRALDRLQRDGGRTDKIYGEAWMSDASE